MKRILFVDDDPFILRASANLLRRQRALWDMVFVESGNAALEEIGRAPCDAIVSDMRMSGMDGATLLATIKLRHPGTIRIVFSGQSERDQVMRTVPVSHQYLGKPCDPGCLRTTFERVFARQSPLCDKPSLLSAIGRLDHLPSEEYVFEQLLDELSRSDTTPARLSAIIETDVAMSVKVLQLVSSSYFGEAQPMSSVNRAVSFLGIDVLRRLVRDGIFESGDSGKRTPTTRTTTTTPHTQNPMDSQNPMDWADEIGQVTVGTLSNIQDDIDSDLVGTSFAEIGEYLLTLWGLNQR